MQRTLYKLTDQNYRTLNGTQWGVGVSHTEPGNGKLCSEAYLHAYTTPLLAVLLNPIHADISNPVLWRALGTVEANDGTKVGCTLLKTIKIIPLPTITLTQRLAFGILCARRVYKDKAFLAWARAWLNGKNRTAHAAYSAACAAYSAVCAASDAASDAAGYAALAGYDAACATGYDAYSAACYAAYAAYYAALAACDAASAASAGYDAPTISISSYARESLLY